MLLFVRYIQEIFLTFPPNIIPPFHSFTHFFLNFEKKRRPNVSFFVPGILGFPRAPLVPVKTSIVEAIDVLP